MELEHRPLFEIVVTRQMPWMSLKSISQLDPDSMQSLEVVDNLGQPMQDESDEDFEIIE